MARVDMEFLFECLLYKHNSPSLTRKVNVINE